MKASQLPWESIVCGVTVEGHCAPAVKRAYHLAGTSGRVRLVHGVDIPRLWGGLTMEKFATLYPDALTDARSRVLDVLARTLGDKEVPTSRLADDLKVEPGPPGKVLFSECSDFGADLLVLGPHEKRGVLEKTGLFDFGSTARAIISKLELPLWSQHTPIAGGGDERIRRILVPVDFSQATEGTVRVARALAERFDGRLTILRCYAPPSLAYVDPAEGLEPAIPADVIDQERAEARKELEAFLSQENWGELDVESVFREGNPLRVINEEALGHDLVIVGSHGRTGLSRFLLGSVAYGVLRGCERPVLVVPSVRKTWLVDQSS